MNKPGLSGKPDNDPQDETGPAGLNNQVDERLLELPPDFGEVDAGTGQPERRSVETARPCLKKGRGKSRTTPIWLPESDKMTMNCETTMPLCREKGFHSMSRKPKPEPSAGAPLRMDLPPDLESIQDGSTLKSLHDASMVDPPAPLARELEAWPRIEGYQILSKLGQGGMGSVFLARDLKLGRQVAIKIVSQVFRDPQGLRGRFDSEIQTLAGLQHTHIAQLYSAGQQGDAPYFVMEYVDGPNLEQLAREPMKPLPVAQIVGKLCDAVGLCHQHGILHRDLKPSNVLMTRSSQPKIADFGLAKVMGADSSTTRTGEILGTPAYMAPEQASGIVKSLSAACDIYSLGAILYRLLTGRPPFVSEDPVQTIMKVISDDPLPPRKLLNTIPTELETICLKCLEKNPQRRYSSVTALQEDLQRFVDGRPILAKPASSLEKAVKWTKRNPAMAVTAAGSVLALILAVVGLSVHNNRLASELNRSRRLAEHGSELTNWLIQEHFNGLATISGTTDTRHSLMQKIREFLDKSFADMPQDPKYTRRLGYAYARLAGISGGIGPSNLGNLTDAEAGLIKALELYDLAAGQTTDVVQIDKLRADACLSLIGLNQEMQQADKSDHYYELAKQTIDRLPGNDWETQFLKIQILDHQVEREASANRHDSALKALAEIGQLLDTVAPDANPVEVENQRIWIASNRAISLEATGNLADAEKACDEAADLARKSREANPANALFERRYSTALVQLGDLQFARQNGDQALANYKMALEIVSSLAASDPNNVELVSNLAQKHSRLGSLYAYLKQPELAEENTRWAIEIHERLEKEGKTSLSLQRRQSEYLLALANQLAARNDLVGATELFERHQALCNSILELNPQSTVEWNQLAENHFSYGTMLMLQWLDQPNPPSPPRSSSEYKAIDRQLSESLRYFKFIGDSTGMSYHQEEYRKKVIALQKFFEDSIDQMDDLQNPEGATQSDF